MSKIKQTDMWCYNLDVAYNGIFDLKNQKLADFNIEENIFIEFNAGNRGAGVRFKSFGGKDCHLTVKVVGFFITLRKYTK